MHNNAANNSIDPLCTSTSLEINTSQCKALFVARARLVSPPKLETETASQHSACCSRRANCFALWKQQHPRFELSCSVATQFWTWPLTACKSKVKSPKPSNPEPKLHLRAHSLPFSCEQRPSS